MLLAIDIGNTLTKFGVFENHLLRHKTAVPTVRDSTAAEIYNQTKYENIQAVIVSSVVSELENAYREFSNIYLNLEPIFVDTTFDFNLKINYQPPESLGIDRLVNAFAAAEKYGSPCIVCSLGTATTIDAVNSRNEFLGGIIAPGMNLFADALAQKTAKLPKVEIEKPASVVGDSTVKSIQAGIYFGYLGLVEGIFNRMIDELGERPKIVATGGFARFIADGTEKIEIVDDCLLLEGLRLIYENRSNKFGE